MTGHVFEGFGQEPMFPEGMGQLMRNILATPVQDPDGPFVHSFQLPPPPEDQAPLPWIEPDIDLTGMSWEEAQRHTSIGFCRTLMHADWQMVMGATCEPPTWDEAEVFYERMQRTQAEEDAEKRATANHRYWSGPDKFDRKILRAYRVKFRHIGLAPRSVLDDRYRRKQINRRKRR